MTRLTLASVVAAMVLGTLLVPGAAERVADKPKEQSTRIEEVDVDLLPADAVFFVSLRFSELWNSETGKQLQLYLEMTLPHIAESEAFFGNPLAEIHRILVFSPGVEADRLKLLRGLQGSVGWPADWADLQQSAVDRFTPVFMITTRKPFEPEKILSFLELDKLLPPSSPDKKGQPLDRNNFYAVGKKSEDQFGLHFAGQRTIVLGNVPAVRAFLELPRKPSSGPARSALLAEGKKNQFLLFLRPEVFLETAVALHNHNPKALRTLLKAQTEGLRATLGTTATEILLREIDRTGDKLTEEELLSRIDRSCEEVMKTVDPQGKADGLHLVRSFSGLRTVGLGMDLHGMWKVDLFANFFTEGHASSTGKAMKPAVDGFRSKFWKPAFKKMMEQLDDPAKRAELETETWSNSLLTALGAPRKMSMAHLFRMAKGLDKLVSYELTGEVTGRQARGGFQTNAENFLGATYGYIVMLFVTTQHVRDAPARIASKKNLTRIGEAIQGYRKMSQDHFPPHAVYGRDGTPLLSWRVAVLPFIEEKELYDQFKLDEPWDSPHNKKLIPRMPRVFRFVREDSKNPTHTTPYQVFVGKETAFLPQARDGKGLRHPNGFPDGISQTLLVVEADTLVPWTKPEDLMYAADQPLPSLGQHWGNVTAHAASLGSKDDELPVKLLKLAPNQFLGLLADGSVQTFNASAQEKAIRAYVTPAGNEPKKDYEGVFFSWGI